jgi:hypothetical protein
VSFPKETLGCFGVPTGLDYTYAVQGGRALDDMGKDLGIILEAVSVGDLPVSPTLLALHVQGGPHPLPPVPAPISLLPHLSSTGSV